MRGHRLVPTLAACVLAGSACAMDGVAPETNLPAEDPILRPGPVAYDNTDPPTAFTVDSSLNFSYSHAQLVGDPPSFGWSSGAFGVALVYSSGEDKGDWQYRSNLSGWINVGEELSEESALLLQAYSFAEALEFRFVPNGTFQDGQVAHLVYRVWDGSDGNAGDTGSTVNPLGIGYTYGGSPTAYSAATRDIAVRVTPVIEVAAGDSVTFDLPVKSTSIDEISPRIDGTSVGTASLVDSWGTSDMLTTIDWYVRVSLTAGSTLGDADGRVAYADTTTEDAAFIVRIVPSSPVVGAEDPVSVDGSTYAFDAVVGQPLAIQLTSADGDNDDLTWEATAATLGTGVLDSGSSGADGGNTYTYTPSAAGTDTITVTVTDAHENEVTLTLQITASANANVAPSIAAVSAGSFAIVGQPFDAIVRATDPNAADIAGLTLAATAPNGTVENPIKLANGLWRVRWTPSAGSDGSGSLGFTVTDHPGGLTGTDTHAVEWLADVPTASIAPEVPVSSAGNPVYGAIAPGSATGFASLDAFLGGQSAATARAFWWTGTGYAELPASQPGDPIRAGVFLATTVPADLTFQPATQPAPFAVDLPAGKWVFFGIPPLLTTVDGTPATSHVLASDFELQDATGTVIVQALPTAWRYRWDASPSDYQPASTILSGTGYWMKNAGAAPLRLVRKADEVMGWSGPFQIATAVAAATTGEKPPPPPGGATAAAADGGGAGGCGAGGLAGLLAAALAMLGLRRGRRA